jgi:hypothetical protein
MGHDDDLPVVWSVVEHSKKPGLEFGQTHKIVRLIDDDRRWRISQLICDERVEHDKHSLTFGELLKLKLEFAIHRSGLLEYGTKRSAMSEG